MAYQKFSLAPFVVLFLLGFASCSTFTYKPLNFRKLAGGHYPTREIDFGILPNGTLIPPSGPSDRTSCNEDNNFCEPPPPALLLESKINFGTLPKGTLIPSSGPSRRTSCNENNNFCACTSSSCSALLKHE